MNTWYNKGYMATMERVPLSFIDLKESCAAG